MSAVESCRSRYWFNCVVVWRKIGCAQLSFALHMLPCYHMLNGYRFHIARNVQRYTVNSFGSIRFLASLAAFYHQNVVSLTCLASNEC
jgi:hypothetical protein